MKIKEKMTLIVLSIGIVTLLVLCGIMYFSMNHASKMAIQYSSEIGKQSDENSSRLLIEQKKKELLAIVEDKANEIDYRLKDMEGWVQIAATMMQKIYAHHADYLLQEIVTPPASGAGKLVFYVQYAKDVDVEALADEIGLNSNIKDTLVSIIENDPIIDSIFVASPKNYVLSVDNNLTIRPNEYEPPEVYYDAVHSDWYRLAVKQHDVSFTPVREFIFSKELGIFCALPFYDKKGNLEGVSCLQTTLKELDKFVAGVDLHNRGFCFVIDERGYVILSSDTGAGKQNGELAIDLHTDRRNSNNTLLAQTVSHMVSGEEGITEISINGEQFYVAYSPIMKTGWSFGAAISAEEVMAPLLKNTENIQQLTEHNISQFDKQMHSIMTMSGAFVLLLLGALYLTGKWASKRFVNPIQVLTDGVREITAGNLDKRITVSTGDEIEHLAQCFNTMTETLKEHIENLARAKQDKERQNIVLSKKNEELSVALHRVELMRIARDNYRAESEIDQLTQIYNKATTERICKEMCEKRQEDLYIALYIIDLDHFKEANDSFGHQYGDRILSEFALQLKFLCRADDCVGRFGGDEFVIMIMGKLNEEVIHRKAQAILKAAKDLTVDGNQSTITASIGIAVAPFHANDYISLFQKADTALYSVKNKGRDNYCIWES